MAYFISTLPFGFRGLLIAGVLSAAMSTLSSSINSASSSIIRDIIGVKDNIKLSRIVSVLWAFSLMAIASIFDNSNDYLVITGLKIASFTYGILLSLFLLRLFNIKPGNLELITSSICGIIMVFILNLNGVSWTWFILISTITTILLSIFLYPIKPKNE